MTEYLIFNLDRSVKLRYIFEVFYAPIAQLVEQVPFKDKVVGSIPTGRTRQTLI